MSRSGSPSPWSPDGTARVAVVGAGIVGVRTARELLTPTEAGHDAVARVSLVGRRPGRLEQLVTTFGSSVDLLTAEQDEPDLGDATVVVVARAAGEQLDVVRDAVDAAPVRLTGGRSPRAPASRRAPVGSRPIRAVGARLR